MLSRVQIKHRLRWLSQRIRRPEVAVIGGYHGGNLGDMALGLAVQRQIAAAHRTGLQTIYGLSQWPRAERGIVGGGAVGYEDTLVQLAARYGDCPEQLALLGVDFNESSYSAASITLLQKAAWVSCRSEAQRKALESLVGRNDISAHPDLAFSFTSVRPVRKRSRPLVLVNTVPLFGRFAADSLVPDEKYCKERPELRDGFSRMIEGYRIAVRGAVEQSLREGFDVASIPFTPDDARMARWLLQGFKVQHLPYSDSVERMLRLFAHADRVLATRYHATIFAALSGAEVLCVAYARKNEALLEEIGFPEASSVSSGRLARGERTELGWARFDQSKVSTWSVEARDAIQKAVSTLGLKAVISSKKEVASFWN